MPNLITILVVLLALVLFLFAFLLARTVIYGKRIEPVDAVEGMKVDAAMVAEHLANAIRKATISNTDPAKVDGKAFLELHKVLESTYPRVHATLARQVVNQYGLLYAWKGRKPELNPVLLAAHLDVVPVEAAGLEEWEHPPFSGQVADGYVWGRGTLDIKNQAIAILEAVESLLKEGYRPERTVLLAFGQDEEVDGKLGAGTIAQKLEEEGVHLEAVLDEGGAVLADLIPGIKSPVATIGVAEKGYLSLELTAKGAPGHSSMPPPHTAIGVLGAALARLEVSPMPARLDAVKPMFAEIGSLLPFSLQFALANLWLFGGVVKRRLESNPKTNAAIRTTQAATMISGGVKDNLLPREARAVVNFRLLPGDTVAGVCEHVRRVIQDERVNFQPSEDNGVRPASPVSPTTSTAYLDLVRVIRQMFPEAAVAPYLVLGATDSRYYAPVCENIYRFTPVVMSAEDMNRVHGTNERIHIESMGHMVQFFGQLIRTWGEQV
jgi:carboxypeptidase PM20D1